MTQRKIQISIILLLAMLATAIITCSSEKNDITDFEKAKSETRTEIQNAIAQIDKTLDTAGVRIDTLGSETSKAYDSTMQDLRQDREQLQKRLSALDQTAQDKWQGFKSGVSHDINKVQNKIRDLDSSSNKNSE